MKDVQMNPELVASAIHCLEMYRADLEYQSKVKSIEDINQDNNSRQWESLDELNGFIRDLSDEINSLKLASEEKKIYRAHVSVYHSFIVEASSEEEARRMASEDVNWSIHVTDCEILVEEEVNSNGGSDHE